MSHFEGVTDVTFAVNFRDSLRKGTFRLRSSAPQAWGPVALAAQRRDRPRAASALSDELDEALPLPASDQSPLVGIGLGGAAAAAAEPGKDVASREACESRRPESAATEAVHGVAPVAWLDGGRLSRSGSLGSRCSMRRRQSSASHHHRRSLQRHSIDCTLEPPDLRRVFWRRMLNKHRFILAAWKALDPYLSGQSCYMQVVQAVRALGWSSNARIIWEALDTDRDGVVYLDDLDPLTARLLDSFAVAVRKACGSIETGWRNVFTSPESGDARCTRIEFLEACDEIGFHGDSQAVYEALSEGTGVHPDDFALLDRGFRRPELAGPAAPSTLWRYFGPSVGVLPPQAAVRRDPPLRFQMLVY